MSSQGLGAFVHKSPPLAEGKEDCTCHKRVKAENRLKKGRMNEAVNTCSTIFRTKRSILKTAFRMKLWEFLCNHTQQTQELQATSKWFSLCNLTIGIITIRLANARLQLKIPALWRTSKTILALFPSLMQFVCFCCCLIYLFISSQTSKYHSQFITVFQSIPPVHISVSYM